MVTWIIVDSIYTDKFKGLVVSMLIQALIPGGKKGQRPGQNTSPSYTTINRIMWRFPKFIDQLLSWPCINMKLLRKSKIKIEYSKEVIKSLEHLGEAQ